MSIFASNIIIMVIHTSELMFITARVTTTWELLMIPWMLLVFALSVWEWLSLMPLVLLNRWLRQGGLPDPTDPLHPGPDPEESESVETCPEEDDPKEVPVDEQEIELVWKLPFKLLSELCVMEETPLVLLLLHPADNFDPTTLMCYCKKY